MKEWVTIPEGAYLAGRSERTVYVWVQRDVIASKMVDGKLHVLAKTAVRLGQQRKRGRPRGIPTRR